MNHMMMSPWLCWSFLFAQKKQFLRLKLKLYLYRLRRVSLLQGARSCIGIGPAGERRDISFSSFSSVFNNFGFTYQLK